MACPILEGPTDELAWFMGNLAGAASDYMTGQIIYLDGGETAIYN
mgnify:CR=1 FL=1